MKILIVTYEFPPIIGGAGVYAHDLATGLALNGHQVDIVTYRSKDSNIKENLKNKYGINIFDFSAKKGLHFIQFFFIIKQLTSSTNYDLIILSDGRAKRVFSLFIRMLSGQISKSISIFHGNEINSFFINPSKSIKLLGLNKNLLRLFTLQKKLVVVSKNEEKLWLDFAPNLSHKLVRVSHGINEDIFYPRTSKHIAEIKKIYNIPVNKKIIVSASRLVKQKGQDNLILAFSQVISKYNDVMLLIIGNGEHSETLKAISEDLNVSEHIRFVGGVDRITLSKYFAISDLFVLVSRYHESFGLVYLEAAACGVPSISGNLGGVTDAVRDGETGIVIDSNDIKELRDAIMDLLNNEDVRKELGSKALDRYRKEFTSTIMANNLINLCNE